MTKVIDMPMSTVPVANKRRLLNLACEGDPEAISVILSSYCRYKGIQVTNIRVRWKDRTLLILCETETESQQQNFVRPVEQILRQLNISREYPVTLYGRIVGQTKPLWSVSLQSEFKNSSIELDQWLNQGQRQLSNLEKVSFPIEDNRKIAAKQSKHRFLRFALEPNSTILEVEMDTVTSSRKRSALIALEQIQEALEVPMSSILPVPYMAACVLGIYNYRSAMLWMVDLTQQLGDRSFLADHPHSHTLSTLVVCRDDGELIGFVVPQILDIESYEADQFKIPSASLFPDSFLPFVESYISQSLSPILNVQALIKAPVLQHYQY
ncbi:MAG: hypothetical protein F6K30_08560 [Cyanothece sp. SIO2G6]|nr:hypothetical protein [Cyanothece sp. SIO2G6]